MQRERGVDVLRAIGIMVMIIDHIGMGWEFYKWSHAFHMPLFFIISGYFFSEEKCRNNLKGYLYRKAKKLWVPYFVFALGSYFVWAVLKHDRPILEPLYNIFWYNSEGIPIATAVWFLPCLFFVEVMFCFCVRITKGSRSGCAVAVLLIAFAGFVLKSLPEIRSSIPYSILPGMVCLPFFLVGHLLRSCDHLKKTMDEFPSGCCVILLLVGIVPIFWNDAVNIRFVKTGNALLFYCNAIYTTLLLWILSRKIQNWGRLADRLAAVGKNSIVYLCVNQMAITGCEMIACLVHIDTGTLFYRITCFAIVMAVLRVVTWLLVSTPLCILIGGTYGYQNSGIDS